MDPLSDVLELVGVKSSIYFQKDFCGAWKMSVANTGFAQFHFIVRGTAVVEYDDQVDRLSAGDLVLFPTGGAHSIGDHFDSPVESGQTVMSQIAKGHAPFSQGDMATRMVCGHFEYDLQHQHPFMRGLPCRILLRTADLPIGSLMATLLPLIVSETRITPLGSRIVVQHLSQALFASILRTYFEGDNAEFGFYAGLRDPRIFGAISAIHEVDGWKYSLADLAAIAGMSRSSFAGKFKTIVGQSPGDYALSWKMLKAKQALQDPMLTVDQVAHDHGYGSASAFSRAFRDTLGVTPSQTRKL